MVSKMFNSRAVNFTRLREKQRLRPAGSQLTPLTRVQPIILTVFSHKVKPPHNRVQKKLVKFRSAVLWVSIKSWIIAVTFFSTSEGLRASTGGIIIPWWCYLKRSSLLMSPVVTAQKQKQIHYALRLRKQSYNKAFKSSQISCISSSSQQPLMLKRLKVFKPLPSKKICLSNIYVRRRSNLQCTFVFRGSPGVKNVNLEER